jgi:hypothetical protein
MQNTSVCTASGHDYVIRGYSEVGYVDHRVYLHARSTLSSTQMATLQKFRGKNGNLRRSYYREKLPVLSVDNVDMLAAENTNLTFLASAKDNMSTFTFSRHFLVLLLADLLMGLLITPSQFLGM